MYEDRLEGKMKDKIRLLLFYLLLCCCSVWLFWPTGERVCVQSHFPLRRKLKCSFWSLTAHTFTHMHKGSDLRSYTKRHTFLLLPHGLTCTHTVLVFPWITSACLPSWLAGCSGASLTWIPSDACFCTPIIQLGERMARALLHTPIRSCAKTPGHWVIVRGGIHYMMLPACTDKKRQGVTYGAS